MSGFNEAASYSGLLPSALHVFRKRHPEVDLQLFELASGQRMEALQARRIDVALSQPSS